MGDSLTLSDTDAVATVAVKNLERAKTFYEQTLGLTPIMENEEVLTFKSGRSTLFVYRSAWFKDPDGNIFSLVTAPNPATAKPLGRRSA